MIRKALSCNDALLLACNDIIAHDVRKQQYDMAWRVYIRHLTDSSEPAPSDNADTLAAVYETAFINPLTVITD